MLEIGRKIIPEYYNAENLFKNDEKMFIYSLIVNFILF